jgi:putative colanic acid biosynthesis acetyltransferase WcaF
MPSSVNLTQDGRGAPNPYGFSERLARIIWSISYYLAYRYVPRIFNWWHRAVLRFFGAKVGRGVIIYPSAEIHFPWRVKLGDHCVVGAKVKLYSIGTIHIGEHSVISQHAHLCAGTHDYADPLMPLIRSNICIGRGCWICTEAFVGPSVEIGDRTVVGARAVVVSNLPGDMVCAGNPCRPIKPRIMKE